MKKIKKHPVEPDAIYESMVVSKFINHVMKKGKKSVAGKIVYNAFEEIKKKEKKDPMEVFDLALKNVAPLLEVKSRRVGGATYQVPIKVGRERRISLAIRWIVSAARKRKGKPMVEKLTEELINAANNTGTAIKKKEDVHRMAQANRAFAFLAK